MKKFSLSFIVLVLLFTTIGFDSTAQPGVKRVVYRDGSRYYGPAPVRRHYVTKRYYAHPPRNYTWRRGNAYRPAPGHYRRNAKYYRHDNGKHKGWYKNGHYYRRH